jgi:hypothetical protein
MALCVRRNETTKQLFPFEGPQAFLNRAYAVAVVSTPALPHEDNKHETSFDWRRHGRGPRDRRPGLGANYARADDTAGFRRAVDPDDDPAGFRHAVNPDNDKADDPQAADASQHGHASSQEHDERRRPGDRSAEPARTRPHSGRQYWGNAGAGPQCPIARDERAAASTEVDARLILSAIKHKGASAPLMLLRITRFC